MDTENKKTKQDSSRKIKVAFGIALILFSIILMINYGPIARTFSWLFVFIFGFGAFFFYIALFALGLCLIIQGKKTFFKKPLLILGAFILFFGLILLFTGVLTYTNKDFVIDANFYSFYLNNFFGQESSYFQFRYITYFTTPTAYGGGLLGYTLYGLMSMSGRSDLGFILSIVIICLGVLIIFAPIFVSSVKKIILKIKNHKKKKEKPLSSNEETIQDESMKQKEKKKWSLHGLFHKKMKVVNESDIKINKRKLEKNFFKEVAKLDDPNLNEIEVFTRPNNVVYTPDYHSDYSNENKINPDMEYGTFRNPNSTFSNSGNKLVKAPLRFHGDEVKEEKPEQIQLDFSSSQEEEKAITEENVYDVPIENSTPIKEEASGPQTEVHSEVEVENEEPETSIFDDYDEIENTANDESNSLESSSLAINQPPILENSSYIKPINQTTIILNNIKADNQMKSKEKPVQEKKISKSITWVPPSLDLLEKYEVSESQSKNEAYAEGLTERINDIFSQYHIGAKCIGYTIGSSVTRYKIEPDFGVQASSINKITNDLSRLLKGVPVRFQEVVEGDIYSGLEVPNEVTTMVPFREVMEGLPNVEKHPTSVAFGKNIAGKVIYADFAEFPHLLVAGTTGSGKSIFVHSIISTLIMRLSPDQMRIVLVDPKQVEMMKYKDMPHLLCPVITDAEKASVCLSKLVDEMNDRYSKFNEADACSDIKSYNEYAKENKIPQMPFIFVVLDEYADLYESNKDISRYVTLLAQKSRAAGIHLLVATQRPSTNVISGTIKANLSTRVALMTASATDSICIIGCGGAETLMGKGDMLVNSPLLSRNGAVRLQGCYISSKEINRIVHYLKEHYETNYVEEYMDLIDHSKDSATAYITSSNFSSRVSESDDMEYQDVKEWVMTLDTISISRIQRERGVGFNKAGRFLLRLKQEGIVSDEIDGTTKGNKVIVSSKFSDSEMKIGSYSQSDYEKK